MNYHGLCYRRRATHVEQAEQPQVSVDVLSKLLHVLMNRSFAYSMVIWPEEAHRTSTRSGVEVLAVLYGLLRIACRRRRQVSRQL